mgnify:CR=1 FL=1
MEGEFNMELSRLKAKLVIGAAFSMALVLVACGGGGSSGASSTNPSSSVYVLGYLPNGSTVYANESSFTVANDGTTTGTLGISGGAAGQTYTFSFNVSPSSPYVTSSPIPCTLTSGADTSTCQVSFGAGTAATGSYTVAVSYAAATIAAGSADETELPNLINLNVNSILAWSRQNGTVGLRTIGYATSVDTNGNIYVAGVIESQTNTYPEYQNYFLAKYSESATLLWTRQVGTESKLTVGWGVAADSSGNAYITGYTTVGISGESQIGDDDYFVAKYSTGGTLLWTKQIGAESGATYGFGISTDSSGNAYITGYTTVGLSGESQVGSIDYFIAKYTN